jgi:hypothetical protein
MLLVQSKARITSLQMPLRVFVLFEAPPPYRSSVSVRLSCGGVAEAEHGQSTGGAGQV